MGISASKERICSRFADELTDINPKSWLSNYRKTSISYLLKMALFYHLIALVPALIVFSGEAAVVGHEEQHFKLSLSEALAAGPFEETLFFGIPFSLSGNPYVVLVTGLFWSSLHLLNSGSPVFAYSNLTYANFAYALPTLFFSLRTWRSGKGWFSILFHSMWDAMAFTLAFGVTNLTIFNTGLLYYADIGIIFIACILLAITFPLYRWRLKRAAMKQ